MCGFWTSCNTSIQTVMCRQPITVLCFQPQEFCTWCRAVCMWVFARANNLIGRPCMTVWMPALQEVQNPQYKNESKHHPYGMGIELKQPTWESDQKTTHLMSTSLKVVSMAFTFCASFSRWAIRCRMRDIFTCTTIRQSKTQLMTMD